MIVQEKYYVHYNYVDDCHELWELTERGPIPQASFYDGDEQSSPLANLLLEALVARKEQQSSLNADSMEAVGR